MNKWRASGRVTGWVSILLLGAATARTEGYDLVVYGAGVAGSWTTELTLSNLNPGETSFGITSRFVQPCRPGDTCFQFVTVPGYGSTVVTYPLDRISSDIGAAYVYIGTGAGPAVLARAHVPDSCVSVDLPVFHLTALRALNPSSLVLAGARSGIYGRSNLLLANVPDVGGANGEPVTIAVEALTAHGVVVGDTTVEVDAFKTVFLLDVVGDLGAGDLENGQVRLTKVGGGGVMWAVMPVVRADGSASVSVGQAP
jgi:hypothetical protein